MQFIFEHWDTVLGSAGAVLIAANAIAALTPTPRDDAALAWVRKALDLIALNVGYAKNKGNAK